MLKRYLDPLWRRVDWPGLGLCGLSLALYVYTLAPGVLPSDHGELQFKPYTLELIHPPGYPLYALAGRAWLSLFPWGSVAYRMNLFSAVCAAAAVWFLYKFIRLLVKRRTAALVGAGLLAATPLFWNYAITAGSYALHALLFSALLYLWLSAYRGRRPLWWAALVLGLGLAHHRLIVVSLPVLAIATWIARRRLLPSRRAWAAAALALSLPLSLYGLLIWQGAWPLPVFLRHVLISGGAVHTVHGFKAIVSRLIQVVWPWLYRDYHGPTLVLLGIGGLLSLFWRRPMAVADKDKAPERTVAGLLIGLLLSHLAFYSLVRIEPDDPRYFVPAYLLIAVGIGVGVAFFQAIVQRRAPKASLIALAFVALPALWAYRHVPEMQGRYDDYFERLTQEAFRTVEQDAIIVAQWTYAMPLYYYQAAEGERPDIQIYMPGPRVTRDEAVAWIQAGRPVYFREGTFGLDWPASGYVWVNMTKGGLYRALADPPAIVHWLPLAHAQGIQAVGLSRWPLQPDTLVAMRVALDIDPETVEACSLTVRLLDDAQQTWETWHASLDRLQVPSDDDARQVELFLVTPPALPPGTYTLVLSLAREKSPIVTERLAGIPVTARPTPLTPQRLVVSDRIAASETVTPTLQLIAVDWPGRRFSENTQMTLRLFWQAWQNPGRASLSLYCDRGDQTVPLLQEAPLLSNALDAALPAGTLLESKHSLSFTQVPPGHWDVVAQVHRPGEDTQHRLGEITVEARQRTYQVPPLAHPFESTLGGAIELLGYDLDPGPWQPGQAVALTLYWRPMVQPSGNNKVFIHLMNAQGELVAQRDALPLGGTVLTSQWSLDEVLTDPYTLSLPPDLPEGDYQLEVGMYRPETGERRVAVDGEGQRWLHDKIVLQQITVRRE